MHTKALMTRMTRTVIGLSSWMKRCFHVSAILHSWLKNVQKQPFRGVLLKRCSENMQQIYRRTPMPKCNFNKVALQLYWNRTSVWVFSCKFAAYFQNTFFQEQLWTAASGSKTRKYCKLWSIKERLQKKWKVKRKIKKLTTLSKQHVLKYWRV